MRYRWLLLPHPDNASALPEQFVLEMPTNLLHQEAEMDPHGWRELVKLAGEAEQPVECMQNKGAFFSCLLLNERWSHQMD